MKKTIPILTYVFPLNNPKPEGAATELLYLRFAIHGDTLYLRSAAVSDIAGEKWRALDMMQTNEGFVEVEDPPIPPGPLEGIIQ